MAMKSATQIWLAEFMRVSKYMPTLEVLYHILRLAAHFPACPRICRKAGPQLDSAALLGLLFYLGCLSPAMANLPPGWSDTDIGAPAVAGSASDTNGGWTVSGGGVDIG